MLGVRRENATKAGGKLQQAGLTEYPLTALSGQDARATRGGERSRRFCMLAMCASEQNNFGQFPIIEL